MASLSDKYNQGGLWLSGSVHEEVYAHLGRIEYMKCGLRRSMIPASVCYTDGLCKTTERIDVLFMVETRGNPRNIVLDGCPIPHGEVLGRGFDAAFAKLLWPLVFNFM